MIKDLNVTLIFPMAGRGARFDYKFKPFLKIEDKTFIELALNSFKKWKDNIKETIFIFLEEQEKEFNVTQKLKEIFQDINHRCIILPNPTNGPAETVRNAIQQDQNISGNIMICDCDHYLDISPMFEYLLEGKDEDCIIPIWNLRGENIKAWSVAAVSDENYISEIKEKELPRSPGRFFGVIGCYFFNKPEIVIDNSIYISDIIKKLILQEKKVKAIQIFDAEFFGDPQRLQNVIDTRKGQKGIIFCDIDGVLIEHEDIPKYDHSLKALPGVYDKLKKWYNEGYRLILITCRSSEDREKLIKALKEANIQYEQLITGLPSGPRYLINDRKPSSMLIPQATAFEIKRNQGIGELEIDSKKTNVLKMFKGGSLAQTLLIESSGRLFIRKVVSKEKSMNQKYIKLKKQYNDLQRLSKLCGDLIPKLYGEVENSFEYYYDMEFLSDYELLSKYPNSEKLRGIKALLKKMSDKIYKPGAYIYEAGDEWLINHLSEKIYSKLTSEKLTPRLFSLVNSEKIIIDGILYSGLNHLLKKVTEHPYIEFLKPTYLCPIHGDLTLENILYKNNNYNLINNSNEPAIKLIDTDSIDFIDPPELDLGKMFQSLINQYELWSSTNKDLVRFNTTGEISLNFKHDLALLNDIDEYVSAWYNIIEGNRKEIEIKGYFYMALHLIRMIPFRLEVSEDQALYALAMAIKSITKTLDIIRDINNKLKSDNTNIVVQ